MVQNMDGSIKMIKTSGLNYYGYPDFFMEGGTRNDEVVFYYILDKIFSLDFNGEEDLYLNGSIYKLDWEDEGHVNIRLIRNDEVNILTIYDQISRKAVKYATEGIRKVYQEPEIEIENNIPNAKEILAYLCERIKSGCRFDDTHIIYYDAITYKLVFDTNRFGKTIIIIETEKDTMPVEHSRLVLKKKLRRIK